MTVCRCGRRVAPGRRPMRISPAWASVAPGAAPGTHESVAGAGVTYTPVRALRMAPGCRSVCTVCLPRGADPLAPAPAPPHHPTAPAASQACPSQSQRETTLRADTDLYQVRDSTRSGWLAHSTHSCMHRTAPLHPDAHPTDYQPPVHHQSPGHRTRGLLGSLGPEWETSPCGCDVPL